MKPKTTPKMPAQMGTIPRISEAIANPLVPRALSTGG
ncbi:Uncharacterised protein [Mycobacteroides abscessus subsp. abscessus]|nr:Uncharacterised protein [Mycobacteroides abscessus subsp. abscessus]